MPALFLNRMGKLLQAGVDNCLPCRRLGIDGSAATANLGARRGIVKDVELNLAGHLLQRLQDIWVLHVVDGNVKRMFCVLDELDELGNSLSANLGALGLEVKMEA